MTEIFRVVIPARLDSTRLPGKVLLDIGGKPLLQHVYESASKSQAEHVLIATDSNEVFSAAQSFGAKCLMTSERHDSGTDRLAEVTELLELAADELVVNVQGDEVGLPPELINQVVDVLVKNPDAQMATLCERIEDTQDISNPDIVKVVFNNRNEAMYFSRSPIPWTKRKMEVLCYRHIGMYAYRVGFLREFTTMPRCTLENQESLEQLRALYHGKRIFIEEACAKAGFGVDTSEDLERAREIYGNRLSV